MRIPIILSALGVCLLVLGWTLPASAGTACVLFAQTSSVGVDSKSINVCFEHNEIARVQTIYSGKSGNMIRVILWNGKSFYKNAMTAGLFSKCVAKAAKNGKAVCQDTLNLSPSSRFRDLTRGTPEQLAALRSKKKIHRLAPDWRERNRCTVGNFCD